MNNREQWIFPGMPVLSLLRAQPGSISVLERFGVDPWLEPHAQLETICAAKGITWGDLEIELKSISTRRIDSDWDGLSLPMLLNHLVLDHADILDSMLPAIRMALTRASGRGIAPGRLAYIATAWPAFTADLAAHMQEEEVFLFPRLLQYDHCVRHGGRHPDFNAGSVKVFIALRMLGNEHKQMDALKKFLSDWRAIPQSGAVESDAERSLHDLLEEFQKRLETHSRIEETVLFPRGTALEKMLYDRAISGSASVMLPVTASTR